MINLNVDDVLDLQYMATCWARHDQICVYAMNQITLRVIEAGIYPRCYVGDGSAVPTVWVYCPDLGWPTDLIERHGWDGRKRRGASITPCSKTLP